MNPIEQHKHDDLSTPKLFAGESLINAPQETINSITQTAGVTYGATEQAMLNALKSSVNDLITKLQTLGLIK